MEIWRNNWNTLHTAITKAIRRSIMDGQVMTAQQILNETVKILGMIELPVIQQKAAVAILGSIQNIQIALHMMEEEKNAERQGAGNGNADTE